MDEDEAPTRVHQRVDLLVEVLQFSLAVGAVLPHQVVPLLQEEVAVPVLVLVLQAHCALWCQADK